MTAGSSKHLYYLRREYHLHSFVIIQRSFSEEERALLRRYGQWLMALERGYIDPITEAQKHFIKACKGHVPPQTKFEKLWIRYTNAVEDDRKEVEGRKAAAEARQNEEKEIEYSITARGSKCGECEGKGWISNWPDSTNQYECPWCQGSGWR